MLGFKSVNKQLIEKIQMRVLSLGDCENANVEIKEILRLLYILKSNLNKKKNPPVDGGGILQMSLSL